MRFPTHGDVYMYFFEFRLACCSYLRPLLLVKSNFFNNRSTGYLFVPALFVNKKTQLYAQLEALYFETFLLDLSNIAKHFTN